LKREFDKIVPVFLEPSL